MQLEVRQQNAHFRHARGVVNPIRMNHRQPQVFQVQYSNRRLFRRHPVLAVQLGVNRLKPALQGRIRRGVIAQGVVR